MTSNPFTGLGTALITPFLPDGSVDLETVRALAERQIAAGVDMLVPCGTTGEGATLETEEYEAVIATVVETAARRVPVIAGAGSNSTKRTIEYARIARESGADAVLVVTPYYNKPSQEGCFRHYAELASAVPIPIVIYNVPGRTGCNMSAETQIRIAGIDSVVATKEASGNVVQVMRILQGRPPSFRVLSGEDDLTIALIAAGADGVISTASNEVPAEFARMVHAALAGDFAGARELHYRLLDLMEVNFVESNPIPVKAAMAMMGLIHERYRLPLVPPSPSSRERIRAVLERLNLLAS
ncbi:MAG: 4-hydroxy-tetrahydrodipicolinate synthase [Bacteroidota bacterium]|nr:4-hydroxy-tetrahydrodipicolinate synthase [Bacteroidota bacterium]